MSATAAPPANEAPVAADATRPKRKRLLLVAVALVAVLAGAGAGYLVFSGDEADATTPASDAAPAAVVEEGAIVEVGTLTTNLSGQPPHYARVGVGLVTDATADPAAVESKLALVKDAIITELSGHTAEDLRGDDGVEGLRASLDDQVTALFEGGEVVRVVLTELLVQ